jgi:hypothetical protein
MNKRFAFLLTLLILVPVILAACGGDDDESGLNNDSFTSAFEALLEGNADPAKELACDEVHTEIEEAAAGMSALTGEEGMDTSVSCEVGDDQASCDMTITIEIEGADPIEETQTITWEVVDGKICQMVE